MHGTTSDVRIDNCTTGNELISGARSWKQIVLIPVRRLLGRSDVPESSDTGVEAKRLISFH